jgi:hypothetical protein
MRQSFFVIPYRQKKMQNLVIEVICFLLGVVAGMKIHSLLDK